MSFATVYRAGLRLCEVHWDCEQNRNDPERQDTQLYGRHNIKEATWLGSFSAKPLLVIQYINEEQQSCYMSFELAVLLFTIVHV